MDLNMLVAPAANENVPPQWDVGYGIDQENLPEVLADLSADSLANHIHDQLVIVSEELHHVLQTELSQFVFIMDGKYASAETLDTHKCEMREKSDTLEQRVDAATAELEEVGDAHFKLSDGTDFEIAKLRSEFADALEKSEERASHKYQLLYNQQQSTLAQIEALKAENKRLTRDIADKTSTLEALTPRMDVYTKLDNLQTYVVTAVHRVEADVAELTQFLSKAKIPVPK